MTAPVYEKRRRARDVARVGARNISRDAGCVLVATQLRPEALAVESELLGDFAQLQRGDRPLVREQGVVHLPEAPLGVRCLSSFGHELRAGVDVVERQMPPDIAHV